jgi:serine/threonine protein kinase
MRLIFIQDIVRSTCKSLRVAHEVGVCHRDIIRISNIMALNDIVQLIYFGLSGACGSECSLTAGDRYRNLGTRLEGTRIDQVFK